MIDLFQLDGQIAVVTGALGKLGPVWVQTLLGAGARTLAVDRPGQPVCEPIVRLQQDYDENSLSHYLFKLEFCKNPEELKETFINLLALLKSVPGQN